MSQQNLRDDCCYRPDCSNSSWGSVFRTRWTSRLLLALLASCLVAAPSRAEEKPSIVGTEFAGFQLSSPRGKEYSLKDFADKKAVVLAFLGTECPMAKLYTPRLNAIHKKFADRGVAIVGICANTQDSMTELTAFVERNKVKFPILKDVGNRVADQLAAERLTEVFVLDAEQKIRYHGRIDDQYGVGFSRPQVGRHDLAEALEELLAGKEISVPETKAVGCHIGRVKEIEAQGEITYTSHIAAILNRRCVECHRSGEIAPFTLTSYDDIIGWEDMIKEVISEKRMPPWFADPRYGHFSNDARLTSQEKKTLFTWIDNGMPEGDPADLPEPPQFIKGWRIEKPHQIVYATEKPFEVPAEGVVDYQYFEVDPGWEEDKYVVAAECRPDNTSVVHHIIAYVLPPGAKKEDDKQRAMLVGYAPGSIPMEVEEGIAIHVPAGSKLLMEMHYTPNGSPQKDHSYVGFRFTDKEKVERHLRGGAAINTDFTIPPHASNHVVVAEYKSRHEEMLLSMTPHMHLRGKSFRYEAHYPDGTSEVLLNVPRYDFNWQLSYELAEPKLLPRGTRIRCTAEFDNSKSNLVNPDPSVAVHWGEQSWDEMMIGFLEVVDPPQKAPKDRTAALP